MSCKGDDGTFLTVEYVVQQLPDSHDMLVKCFSVVGLPKFILLSKAWLNLKLRIIALYPGAGAATITCMFSQPLTEGFLDYRLEGLILGPLEAGEGKSSCLQAAS